MTYTWTTLAERLKAGDEILFEEPLEYGAHGTIPKGTIATVVQNGLNEMACMLVVKVAGDDGEVCIPGPGHVGSGWNERAGVTQVIETNGDKWRVVGVGATLDDGKTFMHLASTTRFHEQKNGKVPVQICVPV